MNNLKNKTALITGATSGIGKSCAKKLAKKGVNLILTGRRKGSLVEFKKDLAKYNVNVKVLAFDVRDLEVVEQKLKKVLKNRKIDILINNAGLALGIEKLDEGLIDNWEKMIDTNIKGLLYVSKMVMPYMRSQNSGHIVNIGSIAGVMTYPGGNVYSATKAAVHTLGEAMNIDLVGTNVRVSNIAPGAVQTEFSKVRFHGDKDKSDAVYAGYKPLKAKDISNLILYVLNAPKHVNIQHALIMPTAQRNPYILHRKS